MGKGGITINVSNTSVQMRSASIQQSQYSAQKATSKLRDNDGDYDHGTGQDDVAKARNLQMAAQPHLGAKVNRYA